MTTPAQCVARMNQGHARVLATLATGKLVDTSRMSFGDLRGLRTVCATLRRWGAINGAEVTDTGRAILAAYRERYPLQSA